MEDNSSHSSASITSTSDSSGLTDSTKADFRDLQDWQLSLRRFGIWDPDDYQRPVCQRCGRRWKWWPWPRVCQACRDFSTWAAKSKEAAGSQRKPLEVDDLGTEIGDVLADFSTLVITGPTGSGKTTRAPLQLLAGRQW